MIHRFVDLLRVPVCSPPFSAFEGSSGDGDVNVYRRCRTNAAGDATRYSDYDDGGATLDGIHDPVLSPDRTTIAFIGANASTGLGELYVVANVPGSTPVMLEDDAITWIHHPMWSPDSSTIVFTRGGSASNLYGGTVESIPAAGGTPTVLYSPGGSDLAYRPAYSYDGAYIAFLKAISGNDELWVMEADGSNAGSIATLSGSYRLDGSQFAWANGELTLVYDNGALLTTVYSIAYDGTGQTSLIGSASFRVSKFAWAPDDSFVVVTRNNGTFWEIMRVELDGSGGTVLDFTHGAPNQTWFRQAFVFENRIWFIERASSLSGGMIASLALDGTDYVEELDVTDDTLLAWFSGGTGFEHQ